MSKIILLVVSMLCFAVAVFSQKAENTALSDRIVRAVEQKLPGWTVSQYPKLFPGSTTDVTRFDLKIRDEQNRPVSIYVYLIEKAEARERRFGMFFMRSIPPPESSKIVNFVDKGFMMGSGEAVNALFSRANLMIAIGAKFPPRAKDPKTPSYYFPAPPEEKEKLLKIVEIIAQTIDGDANPDECRNTFFRYRTAPGETPENKLLTGAADGDTGEVAELLRQNVDPNARLAKDLDFARVADNQRNTALHFAARRGCAETVRALVEAKSDVNAVNLRGETPLMFAAAHNHAEAVRLLIAANADVRAESYGTNAAFYAVRAMETLAVVDSETEAKTQKKTENALSILRALAAKGLDFKKKEFGSGDTLLTALLLTARGKFAARLAETLLGYGVDPNEPNSSGATPLSILANSVSIDSAALMKLLISKGADVNKPDKDNRPPLRVLLAKQSEHKNPDEYSKYINEATAVLVNAGAKE